MFIFLFWLLTTIRSYMDTEVEDQSSPMEPPAKQQRVDPSDDIPVPATISIVWLDDSNQTSQGNIAAQEQLRVFDSNLKLFQNDTECQDYIHSQSNQSQIVLIVNGRLGQQIVPRVQDLPQIISIYVFCWNKAFHEQWAKQISKVRNVVTEFTALERQIHANHFNHISMEVNPPNEDIELNAGLYEFDNKCMISDICMDYLSQIQATGEERDAFSVLYRGVFAGQPERMAVVEMFQESYSADRALSWFRRDPFFQQILETIFKQANVYTMYICRFFIRDIRKQFEQNKCTSPISVYRGEVMSDENLQQLKNSVGKVIPIKAFLSTAVNRDIALHYISQPNEQNRVLFEIEADPQIEGVKPFIKTGPLLDQTDNDEVLFLLGSLFQINEIRDDENGITIVKMTLCASENENAVKSQLNITDGEKDLIGFVQLQCELCRFLGCPEVLNNMDELVLKYLEELSDDHPDRVRCYDVLGLITFATGDWDRCLDWCQKSFEIKTKVLPTNDPKFAVYYDIIACAYLEKGEHTQALDALKQILTIYKPMLGENHLDLVSYYARMIAIHELEQQFTDVFLCYNQVYNIMLKHFPIDDINLAPIYNNIGKTLVSLLQYPLALGYYQTSLNIKLKHNPAASDSTAGSYKSIGCVYKYMDNTDQARTHFQKALAMFRELHSSRDEAVLAVEQLIEELSSPS